MTLTCFIENLTLLLGDPFQIFYFVYNNFINLFRVNNNFINLLRVNTIHWRR